MKLHGKSLKNDKPHHLYQMDDLKQEEVFKYGISDDPIEADGLSKRLRDKLDLMNLIVGYIRFVGKIIMKRINGRKEALKIEDRHITDYEKAKGKRPRGNRKLGRKRKE